MRGSPRIFTATPRAGAGGERGANAKYWIQPGTPRGGRATTDAHSSRTECNIMGARRLSRPARSLRWGVDQGPEVVHDALRRLTVDVFATGWNRQQKLRLGGRAS